MTTERPAAAAHCALAGLNDEQRRAVTAPLGPVLVFAGAGSGKTRVITHRIAWLIEEHGVAPDAILAVTFTNKAAGEMKRRVASLRDGEVGGRGADEPWVATFHAFGLQLLRRFGEDIGLPRGFAVLGADDARRLAKRTARELGVDEDRLPLRQLVPRMSSYRTALAAGAAWRGPPDPLRRHTIVEVAGAYEEALAREGACDFDDLLIRPLELLKASGRAQTFVGRRVQHLLVDEFQDTSPIQYLLVRRLAPRGNVFVVGDDDQSIYSFRGAEFRNILNFAEGFPGVQRFTLGRNYRSSARILAAARALIDENRERQPKELVAMAKRGEKVQFRWRPSEADEARSIGEDIAALGASRGETAILIRVRAQTRSFEEQLTALRIPHFIVGGLRFYERREVLDAIAGVRLALRPEDDAAFRRAIGAIPRGVGTKSLARIEQTAARLGTSLLRAAGELVERRAFRGRRGSGLRRFLRGVAEVRAALEEGPAAAVRAATRKLGLLAYWEAKERERVENLSSLENAAREFERRQEGLGPQAFLDQVALLSAEDLAPDPDEGEGAAPAVLVMTVHAAKGLEFDRVFLAGLDDANFPHGLSHDSRTAIEEERRLFYVGMTRARRRLQLSGAPGRTPWRAESGQVSRFVAEIPRDLLDDPSREALRQAGLSRRGPRRTARQATRDGIRKGHRVHHPVFGFGAVEQVDADGERLTVKFDRAGRRRLVARYARLRRVPRR